MNDYLLSIPRAVFAVTACAMSAITIGLMVIAPAQMVATRQEIRVLAAPITVTPSLNGRPVPQRVTQGSPTRREF